MYMSVIAKMVQSTSKENIYEKMEDESDRKIACVLVNSQNRADLRILKDQSILAEYKLINDDQFADDTTEYVTVTESMISNFVPANMKKRDSIFDSSMTPKQNKGVGFNFSKLNSQRRSNFSQKMTGSPVKKMKGSLPSPFKKMASLNRTIVEDDGEHSDEAHHDKNKVGPGYPIHNQSKFAAVKSLVPEINTSSNLFVPGDGKCHSQSNNLPLEHLQEGENDQEEHAKSSINPQFGRKVQWPGIESQAPADLDSCIQHLDNLSISGSPEIYRSKEKQNKTKIFERNNQKNPTFCKPLDKQFRPPNSNSWTSRHSSSYSSSSKHRTVNSSVSNKSNLKKNPIKEIPAKNPLKTDDGRNIIINTANGNNNIININIGGKPASAEDESLTPPVRSREKRCRSESIEDRIDTDRPLLEDEDLLRQERNRDMLGNIATNHPPVNHRNSWASNSRHDNTAFRLNPVLTNPQYSHLTPAPNENYESDQKNDLPSTYPRNTQDPVKVTKAYRGKYDEDPHSPSKVMGKDKPTFKGSQVNKNVVSDMLRKKNYLSQERKKK